MDKPCCWLPVLFTLLAMCLSAQSNSPILRSLDKSEALRGEVVAVSGENLAKPGVAALFLTNGKEDFPVEVLEQTDRTIRFTVSKDVAFGRCGLLLVTGGASPLYIEQPVKLNVVEKHTTKEEPKPDAPSGRGDKPE
jgi:hypothetical protein